MWLGVLYCTYFNTVYLLTMEGVFSVFALLKFIFPLIMIMSGMDMSWSQVNKYRDGYVLVPGKQIPVWIFQVPGNQMSGMDMS